MFPEADRLSPAAYADAAGIADPAVRAALEKLPSNDQTFADAIGRTLVVLAVSGYWRKLAGQEGGDGQSMLATIGEDPRPWLFQFPGVVRNIPVLEEKAAGRGMITINPERDGIIRRVPLVIEADGRVWPALSLELLRVATGGGAVMVKTSSDLGIDSVAVQGVPIATDERGRLWLHFSKYDRGRYISVKDVIENPQKAAEALNGKLVLIGTSAAGLFDLRATPLEGVVPGVDVHAQILENVFDQANGAAPQLHRPNWALPVELLASVGIASAMIVFVPLLGGLVSLVSGAVLAAALVAGAAWLFLTQGLVFDVLFPLITSFAVFLALTFMNYLREETQRRQIRSAFGQYLSPQFVEELANNPGRLKLGGETKEMTILFSDVRNFTTISETYKTNPQGLTHLINSLLTPLSLEVMNRKGTIDKYMGDNVMAFWNAPLDDPDHAANACAAALAMVQALDGLNAERTAASAATGEPVKPLKVGVGVNSGQCVVGNMGSDLRFDYTVLGDAVNLASRLEGQTKGYGVQILVGAATAAAAGDRFALLPVDLIRVKGKQEPEEIFTLVGEATVAADPAFRNLRRETEAMIAAYRGQRWKAARSHAEAARALSEKYSITGLYDLYLSRMASFEASPPPKDWDGVHVAETK
jgi:adenylate cyclase